MVTFNRLIESGFTNFFRNIWLSLAATSIVTITLFIISTILVLYTLTNVSITNIKDKVGMTAYFNNQTSEKDILDLKAEIELMRGIKSVEYISNTQAREQFIAAHKEEPLWIETLNEFKDSENPLPNSFAIKAVELTDYANISDSLKGDRYKPYFERIRDNSVVINRLFSITNAIKKLGIVLIAVFVLVTIMVMFNTIRLTIYNRREEVEIMRLVGATNWYIRGPFIVEGLMYGLLATIITSAIMFGALTLMSAKVESFLELSEINENLLQTLMLQIIGLNLLVGVVLGIVASSIAIRRYLKI